MEKKVWYIAGASKGLGLALIHKLLTKGFRVAATSRLLPALMEATGGHITTGFLPLEVDGSNKHEIAESIRATLDAFGRIDVIVNNARLGIVNAAASTTVIEYALPCLRRQGHGHIIHISPFGGFAGIEGRADSPADFGIDAGLETIGSSGIQLTTVTYGGFRTQLPNKAVQSPNASYVSIDGRHPGDPKKAAAALIRIAAMPKPPAHLILDSDAYRMASAKMAEFDRSDAFHPWDCRFSTRAGR